ncbi:MAG: cation transporter [Candidatus Sericytochromatia bacterium]|nr:MAG: cation transporter [Candidatus Sericytochromatia bacterium]
MKHEHQNIIHNKKVLYISILITFSFMIIELIGGIISNSLALISDSFHMLNDSFALILSFIAINIGIKKPDKIRSFGYKRIESIIAFVNGILLLVMSSLIFKEGLERIFIPIEIKTKILIYIAIFGMFVNIIIAYILHKNSHENVNIKSAFMHVIADLISSFGVIFSSLVILYTNYYFVDSIVSILISIIIFLSALSILKETFNILMEGIPKNISFENVYNNILSIPEVRDIHDLHIWSLDNNRTILTSHIVISDISNSSLVIEKINKLLNEKFKIHHLTIQIETEKCSINCNN